MLNFLKKIFFKKRKTKQKKKIINQKATRTMLPSIDPRKPLIETEDSGLIIEVTSEEKDMKDKISRSCAVCKFAKHDPDLDNSIYVICLLNSAVPQLKESEDTCLQHELKYKNLKIIVDKGTLLEYDSETAKEREAYGSKTGAEMAGVHEIGEDEWVQ